MAPSVMNLAILSPCLEEAEIAVEIASEDASDHNAMKGQNPEMLFPKF